MESTDNGPDTPRKRRRYRGAAPRLQVRDGRSALARRWRAAYSELAARLGHEPDVVERALLVDAAALVLQAEEPSDPDTRVRVSYALAEALRRLGLSPPRREPKKPDPRAEALERVRRWREEHGE